MGKNEQIIVSGIAKDNSTTKNKKIRSMNSWKPVLRSLMSTLLTNLGHVVQYFVVLLFNLPVQSAKTRARSNNTYNPTKLYNRLHHVWPD